MIQIEMRRPSVLQQQAFIITARIRKEHLVCHSVIPGVGIGHQ